MLVEEAEPSLQSRTITVSEAQHQILAARFEAPDAASRAAASVRETFPNKTGSTAALYVDPQGAAKLVRLADWDTGRAALLGGLVGIIGGSVGVLANTGMGALATKLRGGGFSDKQLDTLGRSLRPSSSAVVLEIRPDCLLRAKQLLVSLGAKEIVTEVINHWIVSLVSGDEVTETPGGRRAPRAPSRLSQDTLSEEAS